MINKNKIKDIVKSRNLDGILLTSPESIFYTLGLSPHQLTVSRQDGFAYGFLDLRENKDYVITMDYEAPSFRNKTDKVEVVAYDTWVGVKSEEEWKNKKDNKRKEILKSSLDILDELISNLGFKDSRIGLEFADISIKYYKVLLDKFPDIEWIDISDDIIFARSVKSNEEIEIYRYLTEASDKALYEMYKHIKVGVNERELIQIYKEECIKNGVYPSSWSMLGAGPNSSILQLPTNRVIKEGESLRFDGGCEAGFKFYKTDFARGWIVGNGDQELKKLKGCLFNAQRKMIESLKPGMKFSELFNIGYNYVKEYLPNYTRGHLGHSISLGPQTADKPYIAPNENREIEVGMILCVEVPFYIRNYNGFNIEDMILVNEDGAEVLTYRTPHFLPTEK